MDLCLQVCENFSFYLSHILIWSVKVEVHFNVLVLFTFCTVLGGKSCSGSGAVVVCFISYCFPKREKTRDWKSCPLLLDFASQHTRKEGYWDRRCSFLFGKSLAAAKIEYAAPAFWFASRNVWTASSSRGFRGRAEPCSDVPAAMEKRDWTRCPRLAPDLFVVVFLLNASLISPLLLHLDESWSTTTLVQALSVFASYCVASNFSKWTGPA